MYRKDRDNDAINKEDGGGCVIAVRRNLISKRIPDNELKNDIWVAVDHIRGGKLYLIVKYIELGSKIEAYRSHFDKIVECVTSSNINDQFILCGDYNLGDSVSWWKDSTSGEYGAANVRGSIPAELLDTLAMSDLLQLNVNRNTIGRTLDLVITSVRPKDLRIIRAIDPLVAEDDNHPALEIGTDFVRMKYLSENQRSKTNFYKANYVRLAESPRI